MEGIDEIQGRARTSFEAVDGRRDLDTPCNQFWKAGEEEEEGKSEDSCGKKQALWPFEAGDLDHHHGPIAETKKVAWHWNLELARCCSSC